MKAPLLSVIIPTYNRAHALASTLASLQRQTLDKAEFEVLVIDDGSTDGTGRIVSNWRDLNLRHWRQDDRGFRAAAARNIGIRSACAPVCVFVDSGMLAAPDLLERHLQSHRAQPGPVAVVGSIFGLDQHGYDHHQRNDRSIRSLIDESDIAGSVQRLAEGGFGDIREGLFYGKYGDRLDRWLAPWVVFWTGNASVATSALRAVGLFDETFVTWGGEDTDLGIRLHNAGVRLLLDRSAQAIHVPHPKALADMSIEGREAQRRATLRRIHRKHRSLPTAVLERTSLEDLNEVLASALSGGSGTASSSRVFSHEFIDR